MGLSRYTLGKLLVRNTECNIKNKVDADSVRGLLNSKGITNTKANIEGRDLKKFIVVRPGGFVFNHRVHDKLGLGYNTSDDTYLFTNDYVSFYVRPEFKNTILLPDYLYMWYLRPEFERYMLFKTYGSATLFFNWDNMCELEIQLPDISVQQKYVAIYKAMVANQQSYERGLEDQKVAFTGYIEGLRKKETLHRIGGYIKAYNEKNTDESITLEQGINIEKKFITPQRSNSNLQGRKIVRHGQFAYCTQLNNSNVAIAYRDGCDCVVSSVYDVFEITRKDELLPEYLFVWLIRSEFGRFVYWASEGSAYEFLNYNNLANYKIPIPSTEIQKAIAELYTAYYTRKKINEQLKAQIKDICPILIRGSLEEGTV